MAINKYNKESPNQPDDFTGGLVTTTSDHQMIHQGGMFNLTVYDTAIVDTGTLTLGFEIPTGFCIALKALNTFGFGFYWTLHAVPFTTYTESGTYLTPNNHLICPTAPSSVAIVNKNPTGVASSGPLGFIFGGGTSIAGTASSGYGHLDSEYIFKAGKHAVVLTNQTGSTAAGQLQFTWIEMIE